MSGLDVEALLESTADQGSKNSAPTVDRDDRHSKDRHERRDRDRGRDESRDRDRDRKRRDRSRDHARRSHDVDSNYGSHRGSENGAADDDLKSPRSARAGGGRGHSRSRERRRDRRYGGEEDRNGSGGESHRGSRRSRGESRSPDDERYYRPHDARDSREGGRHDEGDRTDDRHRHRERRRDDDRERHRDHDRDYQRHGRGRNDHRYDDGSSNKPRSKSPPLNEDERDRRTVFVQQLAARLRTKELIAFFEKVGPVKEAQIVKDRVSGRSKGVGYVEFKQEDSVPLAIQLTGQKLLGIPIIAQLTEAEKNRQAKTTEGNTAGSGIPFHRLYVGNIHFSITESDLQNVFEPFGELEFVQLQKEEQGRSRGYGFVQFRDPNAAKEALEKMNGFDLAGRPIRVGLGNDKFTNESTQNLLQRFPGGQPHGNNFQGSSFSGSGGRGMHAGGNNNFDRASGRDEKSAGGASALDDTDVGGVNFSNFSRDALMRKLARTDEPAESGGADSRAAVKPQVAAKPAAAPLPQASRCVVLSNMFDPAEEEGDNWVKELEDDVKAECTEKYGNVIHIALDPNSKGDIYVKFDGISGGENAIRGLNGRFFGGRQIAVRPVVDAIYNTYTRSRAL